MVKLNTTINIIRKIHHISSLVIFTFVLMYVVSGLFMLKEDWFPRGEGEKVVIHEALQTPVGDHNNKSYLSVLQKDFGIKGRASEPHIAKDGSWIYQFGKPAESTKVILAPSRDSLTLENEYNKHFFNVVNRFHHFRHYEGSFRYKLWALMYDLAALSLIVFALTGILIWLRMKKLVLTGIWLVIPGLIILLFTLFYIRIF